MAAAAPAPATDQINIHNDSLNKHIFIFGWFSFGDSLMRDGFVVGLIWMANGLIGSIEWMRESSWWHCICNRFVCCYFFSVGTRRWLCDKCRLIKPLLTPSANRPKQTGFKIQTIFFVYFFSFFHLVWFVWLMTTIKITESLSQCPLSMIRHLMADYSIQSQ